MTSKYLQKRLRREIDARASVILSSIDRSQAAIKTQIRKRNIKHANVLLDPLTQDANGLILIRRLEREIADLETQHNVLHDYRLRTAASTLS